MFGPRYSEEELRDQLREIELQLEALPNRSENIVRAQELIEELKAQDASVEEIDAALAENQLPPLVEVGRATKDSLLPMWKLNRKRRKLERRLGE